jgi:nucleotide-binding universal stress UspA family protein
LKSSKSMVTALKAILVHVGSSERCDARIDLGLQLASEFRAHLTGLYVGQIPADIYASPLAPGSEAVINYLAEEEAANKLAAAERFEERSRRFAAVNTDWRAATGIAEDIVPLHARYADLVVVGQTDPEDNYPPLTLDFPAALTLSVARPVLVVPYGAAPASVAQKVLVAWNGSREATRAVNDAIPLLQRARKVTVMAVNPGQDGMQHADVPGADLALYLARHGVDVEVDAQAGVEMDAGEWLLSRAADLGADLIVMGAYGHQRLREWVLGGVTRTLVREMTVPVLMSH